MSAVRGTNGKLSAGPLSGISRTATHLVIGWSKLVSHANGINETMLHMNATGVANTSPDWAVLAGDGNTYATAVNGNSAGTTPLVFNQWVHVACWFQGFIAGGQSISVWVNGALGGGLWTSIGEHSADLAHVSFFVYVGGTTQRPIPVGTKLAEWTIFSGLTTAQRDTIIAEAQTKHVGELSITPTHAWRLLDNGDATVGGGNLAITNTVTFDASDHPPVGAAPLPPALRRRVIWVG